MLFRCVQCQQWRPGRIMAIDERSALESDVRLICRDCYENRRHARHAGPSLATLALDVALVVGAAAIIGLLVFRGLP